ncbi:hypothetical protein HYR99_04050 [Candidatus Poribacteria bacterium]|nr:hypothetical protein [Candidatus Poribacteria bacterium]
MKEKKRFLGWEISGVKIKIPFVDVTLKPADDGNMTHSTAEIEGNRYCVIQEVRMREVLEHFLHLEITRPQYMNRRQEILGWLSLSDQQFFQRVRQFATERDDVPPALTWTVGTLENTFHLQVRRWILAEVDLSLLYTCGLNPLVNDHLAVVRWNLKQFGRFANQYPEFQLNRVPSGEHQRIIGIVRHDPDRDGCIEIVDGAHRVVAMLANNIKQTIAFLGELKQQA